MRLILSLILLTFALSPQCLAQADLPSPTDDFYFSSDRTGNFEIYLQKDGDLKQLTNNKEIDSWWSRVSPDKSVVVFYRSPVKDRPKRGAGDNNYKFAALWKMDSEGRNQREIIPNGAYDSTSQGVADWSPDGKKIVMAFEIKDRWNIYITNAEGRKPVRVSKRDSIFLDPSFSPDGKKIVYSAFPESVKKIDLKYLEIFTSNIDGSDEKRLTFDELRDHDPYWSPDGKEIAFETHIKTVLVIFQRWAIRSVDLESGKVRTIISDNNINTVPRWSKDSKTIYIHRLQYFKGKFHLAKMNRDGSGLVILTKGAKKYDDNNIDPLD